MNDRAILAKLEMIQGLFTGRLDELKERLERLELQQEKHDEQAGKILAETSATRTEVRVVTELQRAHDAHDNERFSRLYSDFSDLRQRVGGVEDSSQQLALTVAHAEVVTEREDKEELQGKLESTETKLETTKLKLDQRTVVLLIAVAVIASTGALSAEELVKLLGLL
jgi:hypothetical protein